MRRFRGLVVLAVGGVLLGVAPVAGAGAGTASSSVPTLGTAAAPVAGAGAAAPRVPVADPAAPATARWIDVSVATLWTEPGLTRSVDAPASSDPADPRRWLADMTLLQRKWLNGHLETQALYGQAVTVLQTSGKWSKVAVIGQSTPRLATGYPGWLPTVQLTDVPPAVTSQTARVVARTATLHADAALTSRVMSVSYGTDLPVVSAQGSAIEVVDMTGRSLYVKGSSVRVASTAAPHRKATGKRLVTEARRFLGLAYLWGGTSGFGFDCSGFTYAVHRQLGVSIPRDAGPQFAAGTPVARANLRKGDLVFFRNSTGIHHVGMYVGGGRMIHSPRTGRPIAIVSLKAQPWAREFAGGRRYVG